jgi:predicted enzyme related to lactoylglutathione lyase
MSGHTPHSPAPSKTGLFRRISLTIILVSDLKRSIKFYRDQLGLTLTAETSEWAEFRIGESRLALQAGGDPSLPNPHRAAGYVSFSFEVDDVVEAYEVLKAAGVAFSHPPAEQDFGMLAVLHDPDGRDIMLFEPR